MTNSDLRQRAEAITRLMKQRSEIDLDIKAAFAAAASVGFNSKALKQAIKIVQMDAEKRAKHDAEQGDLMLYLEELEGRNVRAAA